jgi:fructose-specific phosphotransferase system IIC component
VESEQIEVKESAFNEQAVKESEKTEREEEIKETEEKQKGNKTRHEEDRSSFIHGLSVGLGIGCITAFVITWITVFFSPMLPSTITYESMLSVFIYPLIYLLAVGLITLTAGVVREYYTRK